MAMTYAICCAPGCVIVAITQHAFYGSPLRVRVWLALGAVCDEPCRAEPQSLPVDGSGRPTRRGGARAARTVAAAGLAYRALSDDVSREPRALRAVCRLRRLVVSQISAADDPARADPRGGGLDAILRRLRVPPVGWVSATAVVALSVLFLREARERRTFELQQLEARFERAGAFVGRSTAAECDGDHELGKRQRPFLRRPQDARVGRPRSGLARSCAGVCARRRATSHICCSSVAKSRTSGSGSPAAAVARLDWPPMAEVASQVRIYRPDDSDRYLQGTLPPTEYVP